jgi:hypothetical protein
MVILADSSFPQQQLIEHPAMEILVDSSIPEPSRQVPLQQQLIERAASQPIDPRFQ